MYRQKDYSAECDMLEVIFAQCASGSTRTIVDLGCGTGSHAVPLAERGYDVVGIDRSPAMLDRARRKALNAGVGARATFIQEDLRFVDLGRCFDAALMMFAVLSYQVADADVLGALEGARRHLRSGGLLIFDAWYGPAVLHEGPSQREREIPTAEGSILRVASGELDVPSNLCNVSVRLLRRRRDTVIKETEEQHVMRYFFSDELRTLTAQAGLELLRLAAWPEIEREPDETTWTVAGVASAR